MPYIDKKLRESIDEYIDDMFTACHTSYLTFSNGELNYIITTLLHKHLLQTKLNYNSLNECIGILECAKLELYRMVVAKYEGKKQIENGPISELDSLNLEDVR